MAAPEPTVSSRPTPEPASPAPPAPAATPVRFETQWRGRVQLPLPASGGLRPAHEPPRVIRDQTAYQQFVSMIPKQRVQMKQPAPPSDDPLLELPPIHFDRQLLLVAFRADSMYVGPKLHNARLEQGKLVVDVAYPSRGASRMAAARVDVGTYHAVLVPRVSDEVEIRDPR